MSTIGQDFDPLTGLKTTYAVEDGEFRIHYEQDVEGIYERLKRMRNEDDYKRSGIKNGFMHALSIAPVDQMRMLTEDGFDAAESTGDEILSFVRRNKDKYGHCFAARGNI